MANVVDGRYVASDREPRAKVETTAAAQRKPARLVPGKLPRGARLIGPLLVLFGWELASRLGYLSPYTLAAPSTALKTGYEMVVDGTLVPHLLASAARAYSGLFLGVLVGVILALLSGLTRTGEALIDGIVQIKRAVPTLALIPLVIIWLGIGEPMKVFLIFTAVLVPVYIIPTQPYAALTSDTSNSRVPLDFRASNSSAMLHCQERCQGFLCHCGWRLHSVGQLWSCSSSSTRKRASVT